MDGDQGRLMIPYGRWIKGKLSNTGTDVTIFQAHSCRAASTSKVRQQGIKILEIVKRGCWSNNKDIKSNSNDFDYLSVVLPQM